MPATTKKKTTPLWQKFLMVAARRKDVLVDTIEHRGGINIHVNPEADQGNIRTLCSYLNKELVLTGIQAFMMKEEFKRAKKNSPVLDRTHEISRHKDDGTEKCAVIAIAGDCSLETFNQAVLNICKQEMGEATAHHMLDIELSQ